MQQKKYIFDIYIYCVDNYITRHGISWDKCISLCTDGAKAMTGKLSGAVSRINNVANGRISNHCFHHIYT